MHFSRLNSYPSKRLVRTESLIFIYTMARRSSQKSGRSSGGAKRPRSAWQLFVSENREEVLVRRENQPIQNLIEMSSLHLETKS